MTKRLESKSAIITGAGSGIGRACALRFAAEGAYLLVNDLQEDRATAVVEEITTAGGTAAASGGDVANSDYVNRLIQDAVTCYGKLDVLVNNAAAPLPGPVAETTDETWEHVLAVTLNGTFHGVRAALGVMVPQGVGSIINIASGAGLRAVPFLAAYGAAKAAVINLTRTAAIENAMHGVRVNTISPGAIGTPPMLAWVENMPGGAEGFAQQIPARCIGDPDDIANMALFLASDESTYVNGAVMVVDGGVAAGLGSPS